MTGESECRCQIVGWTRDPGEPHVPSQAEWEQADDCPVHPAVDYCEHDVSDYLTCGRCAAQGCLCAHVPSIPDAPDVSCPRCPALNPKETTMSNTIAPDRRADLFADNPVAATLRFHTWWNDRNACSCGEQPTCEPPYYFNAGGNTDWHALHVSEQLGGGGAR